MGIFFRNGENKVRPGVYQRYETVRSNEGMAYNGICAIAFASNWGPLGKAVSLDDAAMVESTFGKGGKEVEAIYELFNGGASQVVAVRVGIGGTVGTIMLKDTGSGSQSAVKLNTKYVGDRKFSCLVREALGDSTTREFVLYENNTPIEKISFPVSESGEVDALLDAVNRSSQYLAAEKVPGYNGTGKLAVHMNAVMIPVGTNPTILNESYSAAFVLLETARWNTICVTTDDTAIHKMLATYMDRVYESGKMGFAVVGEPVTTSISTRLKNAEAFNNYKVVYVGGGWIDQNGACIDGYRAAARIAGMVAAIPSNRSITHTGIAGAVRPSELLTNNQYEAAIKSGMITFSLASTGMVWVESGITTLCQLSEGDDAGWKKIKRAKIRFEMMTRASDSIEPLIGKIVNNIDGQAHVIQIVQGILNQMIAEEKLLDGATVELDDANPPQVDSAWFKVIANDIDSLEKVYLTFRFRFTPNHA